MNLAVQNAVRQLNECIVKCQHFSNFEYVVLVIQKKKLVGIVNGTHGAWYCRRNSELSIFKDCPARKSSQCNHFSSDEIAE